MKTAAMLTLGLLALPAWALLTNLATDWAAEDKAARIGVSDSTASPRKEQSGSNPAAVAAEPVPSPANPASNRGTDVGDRPAESTGIARRADGWIELKIRGLFVLRPEVRALRTGVLVRSGVVTLTGTAATPEEKNAATLYAAEVDGVTSVRNEMRVEPPAEGRATKS